MFYTKPRIIRIEASVLAIQSINETNPNKPTDIYVECFNPPTAGTIGAYEADE